MRTPTVEDQLLKAVQRNDVEAFLSVLHQHPDLDINYSDHHHHQFTCLHYASWNGSLPLVRLLLQHPGINVNQATEQGSYPLFLACANGHVEVVKELLLDPRVTDINIPIRQNGGQTPLWSAARQGRLDLVKWLIASGRFLDPTLRNGKHDKHPKTSPLEVAVKLERQEVAELLQRFQLDPVGTRAEIQRELGLERSQGAEVFVLAVFLTDGYLRIVDREPERDRERDRRGAAAAQKESALPKERLARLRSFWRVMSQLPLELQMVLANRYVGSAGAFIRPEDSEAAFRKLGIILTRMQHTHQVTPPTSGHKLTSSFSSSSPTAAAASSASASSASSPQSSSTGGNSAGDNECLLM